MKALKVASKHSKNSSVVTRSEVTPREFLNSDPVSCDFNQNSDEKKKYLSFGMKPHQMGSQEETLVLNERIHKS